MTSRLMKVVPIVLILLLVLLQYRLWFEPSGVFEMIHLKKIYNESAKQNTLLKKRNQELASEVRNLQQNKEIMESKARHELGMVKRGETFYQVVNQ